MSFLLVSSLLPCTILSQLKSRIWAQTFIWKRATLVNLELPYFVPSPISCLVLLAKLVWAEHVRSRQCLLRRANGRVHPGFQSILLLISPTVRLLFIPFWIQQRRFAWIPSATPTTFASLVPTPPVFAEKSSAILEMILLFRTRTARIPNPWSWATSWTYALPFSIICRTRKAPSLFLKDVMILRTVILLPLQMWRAWLNSMAVSHERSMCSVLMPSPLVIPPGMLLFSSRTPSYHPYTGHGWCIEVKQPKTLHFQPYQQAMIKPGMKADSSLSIY